MSERVTAVVLVQDLLRRWKVAVLVAAAVTGGAAFYAESLPNQYEGRSILAFGPRPRPDGTSVGIGADTVRVVLPKYVAYVTSRATVDRVADSIGESASMLRQGVDATITADSGNITITVEMPSPQRAASAANALAAETLRFNNADALLQGIVVAPALAAQDPSGPPRTLIELAALLVGLLLGAAVAFLLERGRPRVRTWRDVGVITGYPVVGRVPPARVLRSPPGEALSDPRVGAAIRTLRTNLERLSRDQPVHVLAVTSSVPSEGKTTVASNLAVTLARLDAEVLLLDADLRRPGVSKLFGLREARGLHTVLRGEDELADCLYKPPLPGLHILPTQADNEAGDLLARHFGDVLRTARERFDVVVVDAPPILGGDDARTIATLCDGVLVVVGADTLANLVEEAAAALDALGVRVLGAVANRARDPKGFGAYGLYGTYGMAASRDA